MQEMQKMGWLISVHRWLFQVTEEVGDDNQHHPSHAGLHRVSTVLSTNEGLMTPC